jgi:hypothetical protein
MKNYFDGGPGISQVVHKNSVGVSIKPTPTTDINNLKWN